MEKKDDLLLDCPFCGEVPIMEPWHGGGHRKQMIACINEKCFVQPHVTGETPNEAKRRWNKRTQYSQVKPVVRRYEYLATQPRLPLGATSPIMDSQQMTEWLNLMATRGWDFIGYGEKWWHDQDIPQQWWIFRRIHSKV